MLQQLITHLKTEPSTVEFTQVMKVIEENYNYSPQTFHNGEVTNEAGTNEGSCKIFAFAQLQQLNKEQTLACFGQYYRDDVLAHPEGDDHANIRQFIKSGWDGIHYTGKALILK